MPARTVTHFSDNRLPRRHGPPRTPVSPLVPASLAGRIRWLPPKHEIPAGVDCSTIDLDDDAYNHPVVILSATIPHDRIIEVLMVTSFREKDLEAHFREPHRRHLWAEHLPIHPSKPHPTLDGVLLRLTPGCRPLKKNSYVKIAKRVSLPVDALRWYDRGNDNTALGAASYRVLAERCGYAAVYTTMTREEIMRKEVEADVDALFRDVGILPRRTPSLTERPAATQYARVHRMAPACSYANMVAGQRQPSSPGRYTPADRLRLPGSYPAATQAATERTRLWSGSATALNQTTYGAIASPRGAELDPAKQDGPSVWMQILRFLGRAVAGTTVWFWDRRGYIIAWMALVMLFYATGWCVVKGLELLQAGWAWLSAGVSGAVEGVVHWFKNLLGIKG